MKISDETGARLTGIVLIIIIGVYGYLWYAGYQQDQKSVLTTNETCGNQEQVSGYCCATHEKYLSGNCTN